MIVIARFIVSPDSPCWLQCRVQAIPAVWTVVRRAVGAPPVQQQPQQGRPSALSPPLLRPSDSCPNHCLPPLTKNHPVGRQGEHSCNTGGSVTAAPHEGIIRASNHKKEELASQGHSVASYPFCRQFVMSRCFDKHIRLPSKYGDNHANFLYIVIR